MSPPWHNTVYCELDSLLTCKKREGHPLANILTHTIIHNSTYYIRLYIISLVKGRRYQMLACLRIAQLLKHLSSIHCIAGSSQTCRHGSGRAGWLRSLLHTYKSESLQCEETGEQKKNLFQFCKHTELLVTHSHFT